MKKTELAKLLAFTDAKQAEAAELSKAGNVHYEIQAMAINKMVVELLKLITEMKGQK